MANTRWLFKGGRDPKDYLSVTYTATTNPSDSLAKILTPANNEFTKLVLYTHGVGEDRDAPTADVLKIDLIKRILAEGWCVLSHNAQGDAWGNLASINDYKSAITWAKTLGSFTEIVLLSQSMGGLSGLHLLKDLPEITKLYGIYPACNLANMFTTAFKADIKTAYGFTNDADYSTATAGYDPMLFTDSVFTGKKLRVISSYGDIVVTRIGNTDQLVAKVDPITDVVSVDAIGNHGDTSHFIAKDVIDFYKS